MRILEQRRPYCAGQKFDNGNVLKEGQRFVEQDAHDGHRDQYSGKGGEKKYRFNEPLTRMTPGIFVETILHVEWVVRGVG